MLETIPERSGSLASNRLDQLVFPNSWNRRPTIVIARNLANVPPPFDALPDLGRRPYARIDIREPISTPSQTVTIRKSGLLVIEGGGLDDLEGHTRRLQRQAQRLGQFERMTELADRWEKDADGVIADKWEGYARRLVLRLRRVAGAMYSDELSKEDVTSHSAQYIIDKRLPGVESVLNASEDILRANSFNVEHLQQEVERALKPSPNRIPTPINKELSEEEREKRNQESEQEAKKRAMAIEEAARAEAHLIRAKIFEMEVEYDPTLDRPSPEVEEYFEALWKRPF